MLLWIAPDDTATARWKAVTQAAVPLTSAWFITTALVEADKSASVEKKKKHHAHTHQNT